ncbi:MAG: phage coat protein [Alteromonadaceae bacterium]|nr:phage coat protein [Alteromonadaceae bacterium]HAD31531.1 phage coat protein [Methylophaga sp.]HCN99403.1 phage coat protein [Methylophaga sp.]|tara:strand:- start:24101 stop:25111 length:1011 start_codon:yes stop_codon:yes gene_type:complete
MATVQLSDIIDVTVFRDLPAVNGPEKTVFFQSGVVTRNSLLDEIASAPGKTAELPFWKDLDGTVEVNYSTDDPSDVATPQKVVQGEQIARKAFVNQGWSKSDLASEIAMGPKAMDHIRSRTDTYFQRQWQRRLIASANGVLADNVANDSGDMVVSVAAEATGSVTADTRFNRDVFTEAVYTMGDASAALSTMAVHSAVMEQMVKNDDIVYMPDSQGNLTIPTYMGLRVVVDDGMTVTAGTTSGFKYTSVIFGAGAFGYGVGSPDVPVEVEREAAQGEGGGIETLWIRNTWVLHPFGFQNTGTPASVSFTLAELAGAARWDRVIERKNIPMAFLITN